MVIYVVGLLGIGYVGGWWSLPFFAFVYLVAAHLSEQYFWQADPRFGSIDGGISPVFGYELTMPFFAVPIALGALARRATRIWRHTAA